MSRRDRVFDLGLALVVGLLAQLEVWLGFGATHRQGPSAVQSLLYATTAALLVFRRVRPLACVAAIAAVSVAAFAAVGSPEGFAVAVAPCVAAYTAGRWVDWRRSVATVPIMIALWSTWALLDPVSATWSERVTALVWTTPSLIAWLLGVVLRLLRLTADQRRTQQEERAARAVVDERARIARELHDVLGHTVSVMTVQASAVRRRLHPDQPVERQALEAVEAAGREALSELRRLVGVLRDPDRSADLAPLPGLADLDRLLDRFRAAGLPATLQVTGTARALPPAEDLTAYRLVQEGLTNTLRHARRPTRADVEIAYAAGGLTVSIRDDGQPGPVGEMGAGLAGMRERVHVHGGTLQTRVGDEGGYELVATVPTVRP